MNRVKNQNKVNSLENKKFRINFLIDEQYKYMKSLENELKNSYRHKSGSKTNLKLDNIESYDDHDFFDYNENIGYVKHLIGDDLVNVIKNGDDNDKEEKDNILKTYQANLIRYEAIKKLKIELDIARINLHKSMKTQKNLNAYRNRVKWLENEIESILLSNKQVNL
jgi:hypothetical protein